MKRAVFHPEADTEFARVAEFYNTENRDLGAEFVNEVEQTIRFVRTSPGAGTPVRGAIRRWRVRRFPYSIIYREEPDRLYVLAVAHYRRHPSYWEERV